MSIAWRVLGEPGRDNVVRISINAGTRITALQFDCGDRCLHELSRSEIRSTEHLFFSHLHMDHVAGFDGFFRCNFDRAERPVNVWGPPGTARILHHRFRGFWWNMSAGLPGEWIVHDVHETEVRPWRFRADDAFESAEALPARAHADRLIEHEDYRVEVIPLSHHGTSLGYRFEESPGFSVVPDRLARFGVPPGPWLGRLKGALAADPAVTDAMSRYGARDGVRTGVRDEMPELGAELREALSRAALRSGLPRDRLDVDELFGLFEPSPRESLACLTDYLLDEAAAARLVPWLARCDRLISEAQYAPEDAALAARNHHVTVDRVAALARDADVGELVLMHLSERYDEGGWQQMLRSARASFGNSRYPAGWMESAECSGA